MGKNPAEKAKEIDNKKTAKEKAAKQASQAAAKQETKAKKKPVAAHVGEASRDAKHCKIKSCKREYKAKGYCKAHYKKWRHGEYGVARYKTCSDFECRKPMALNRHGYCEEHFTNYFVKGMEVHKAPAATPAAAPKKEEAKEAKSA